jgi:hypothetical protein
MLERNVEAAKTPNIILSRLSSKFSIYNLERLEKLHILINFYSCHDYDENDLNELINPDYQRKNKNVNLHSHFYF